VGACFIIAFYTGGVIFYGFTAVFEPIAQHFRWSYTQISFAASLRGLEMGILAPLIGILVDRWGPRKLLIGGTIVTTLGLLVLSRTVSLGMFYGAFALLAVGTSICSTTVFMPAVANWFRRKIGLATGIMVCGYGFSGLLVPLMVRLIDLYGWQAAIAIFAAGMLIICLPLSLIVRHRPEHYGYQPDGEINNDVRSRDPKAAVEAVEISVKAKEALKNRAFWHITLALLCQTVILMAVITHIMPYLSSIGIPRTKSGLVASVLPLISIGGRLGLGWLGDRSDKRRVMAAALAMMGIGILCFGFASPQTMPALISFLVLFGIGYGGINTLRASILTELFGRGSFGTIHGATLGIMDLGGIAGPPIAGYVYDKFGTYQPVWLAFAVLIAIAVALILNTPQVNATKRCS
jgi:sugar phosphate permease